MNEEIKEQEVIEEKCECDEDCKCNEKAKEESEPQKGNVSFSKDDQGHYLITLVYDDNKIVMDALQYLKIAQQLQQSILQDQKLDQRIITPNKGNIILPR